MLEKYIGLLGDTIEKLTNIRPRGDFSLYFEAVGLGFLTLFLVVAGIVAFGAIISLPIVITFLPWKFIGRNLRKEISELAMIDTTRALSLLTTYNRRLRIYIACACVFWLPFVIPFILLFF